MSAPGRSRALTSDDHVPWRIQGAVYACGMFNGPMYHIVSVIMPLWALMLDASPLMIGVVIGSRQVLPMLFAIHGGALMDRVGTRRILLFFGAVGMAAPILFPVFPWVAAAIVLQMISGLAESVNWIGAQALVGQAMKGHPVYAGRLSVALRMGNLSAPPLIGAAWDLLGPWGAFGFLSLWVGGGLIAALVLPAGAGVPAEAGPRPRITWRDFVPRPSDYIAAFRLLAIPAILLVMATTVLRHSGTAIQGSFYVVYLEQIGITGTSIGLLLGVFGVVGAFGSLTPGPLGRFIPTHWLLIAATLGSIVFMAVTPLLGSFALLLIAIGLRGGVQGMSMTLMISITAQAAGADAQGKGVAVRITANRLTSMLVPMIMGAVVEAVGLENGFYIIGGVAAAATLMIAHRVARSPAFGR